MDSDFGRCDKCGKDVFGPQSWRGFSLRDRPVRWFHVGACWRSGVAAAAAHYAAAYAELEAPRTVLSWDGSHFSEWADTWADRAAEIVGLGSIGGNNPDERSLEGWRRGLEIMLASGSYAPWAGWIAHAIETLDDAASRLEHSRAHRPQSRSRSSSPRMAR